MTTEHDHAHPLVPYSLYFKVWVGLIVLTVVTVSVSCVDLKHVSLLTAALIATAKSMLVLLYFMHVRFGKLMYAYMILAVVITYGIFVGLTFVDYSFR